MQNNMLAGNERVHLFKELESLDLRNIPSPTWMETPTPHRMAVTILVQKYIEKQPDTDCLLQTSEPKYRKNLCMLLHKLMQYPDMSYSDLYQLITISNYKIDPIHMERFEECMSRLAVSNFELAFDLAQIQETKTLLTEEASLSQLSLVGVYMRRVQVVLQRMTFPEKLNLHEGFCKYYEKGVRTLAIGPSKILAFMYNEEECPILTKKAEDNTNYDATSCSFTSADGTLELGQGSIIDFEDCITPKTPQQMQPTKETRAIKETPQQQIEVCYNQQHARWSEKQAELFVQQQCQLLETNAVRALSPIDIQKKVFEIIESNPLFPHAYYLAYMNQARLCDYFGARETMHRAFDRSPNNMMHLQDQTGFQYFSLSLSKLQSLFGHKRDAFQALRECVMLAQESGDKRCLELATTIYSTLQKREFYASERIMPTLQDPLLVDSLSLAILNFIKFGAEAGITPLESFEILAKSDEVNSKHNLIERITDILALRSALWCIYGRSDFSILYAQMVLDLDKCSMFGDAGNVDSVCMAFSTLIRWLYVQGMPNLGKVIMQHTSLRFRRPPMSNSWMMSSLMSRAEYAIYSCGWRKAEKLIAQLHTFSRPYALLLSLTVAISRGNWPMTHKILTELKGEQKLTLMQTVRMLVLEAFTKQMTPEGLMSLFKAVGIASANHMVYEEAYVKICIAQLQLCNGMVEKAYRICMSAVGKILQSGGVYERSLALFVFLRCRLALANTSKKKAKLMMRMCSTADRVIKDFSSIKAHGKVFDVITFMGNNFHELGHTAMRNRYASKYCRYYSEYPQGIGHMNVPI